MPVNLSIKDVPDELAERLRARARRHHRSLRGEVMVILEEATSAGAMAIEEADTRLRLLGLRTPDEATMWVREMRDAR